MYGLAHVCTDLLMAIMHRFIEDGWICLHQKIGHRLKRHQSKMEECEYGSLQWCNRAQGASTGAVAPKDFQALGENDGNVDRMASDARCVAYCVSQGTLCADAKGKVVDGRSVMSDE